mmetsp:Transcript_157466/g.279283  ORF Transcript_157466/g.279283 Transcript_157466/m.279283 type:complete len:429 (+) Transcript_157466:113-1399(+)
MPKIPPYEEPEAPAERFIAPFAVTALHLLLLLDVAMHRRKRLVLMRTGGPLVVCEWILAACAALAYLRTVISDPGFLRRKSTKPDRNAAGGTVSSLLSTVVGVATCGGCCGLLTSPLRGSAAPGRDPRDVKEAREMQPIGRPTFDEDESDPGEEVIELADLESGAVLPGPAASPGITAAKGGANGNLTPTGGRKRRDAAYARQGDIDADSKRPVMQSGHKLRYCRICQMHQPLRTKHCRDCGRCVRTHDHHCPWIGTCVGEGNRLYFYWFLLFQLLELVTFGCEGVLHLLEDGLDLLVWVNKSPMLILGLLVIGLLAIMVSCLLSFHSYLAMTNQTTWENISWHNISYLRSIAPEDGSPFSQTLCLNLAAYCCLPCCVRSGCSRAAAVKRDEDGWAIWELGEPRSPLECDCSACGGDQRCNCCECFVF